jgi:hypothetical protein
MCPIGCLRASTSADTDGRCRLLVPLSRRWRVRIVRPEIHTARQGLHVSYRAGPGGRFRDPLTLRNVELRSSWAPVVALGDATKPFLEANRRFVTD